jgi:hypothetical protein
MSGKNQSPITFNWQSANPATGFLPLNGIGVSGGSLPSGTLGGTMSSTNTIYSQIIDVSRMDDIGLEFTWTGSPTGTISILASDSGAHFYAYTPIPALTQPSGSASGFATGVKHFEHRYLLLQYVNSSGSGTLTVYGQQKDLN